MYILIGIVKVIVFLLLLLFGLLLTALLLLLLVPFRYRLEAAFHGKPRGSGRITWLFHLLSLQVAYEEEWKFSLSLFGRDLFQKQEEKERVEEAVEQLAEEGKEIGKEMVQEEISEAEPIPISKPKEEAKPEPKEEEKPESKEERTPEPKQESKKEAKSAPKTEAKPLSEPSEEQGRWERCLGRLEQKKRQILDKLQGMKKGLERQWKQKKSLWELLKREVSSPQNQKSMRLLLRQAKAMLRHVLPKKAKGHIEFGLEDPSLMGQILAGAALLYPLYGEQIQIVPVFDKKHLEGEILICGRVRVGTMGVLALRLLFDETIRKWLRRFLRSESVDGGDKEGNVRMEEEREDG
ncbi:MAG: DUF2953 domain-containing protein [bacterium]|nr:DUF2953 domain-containing protein [bacterium]